MSQDESDAALVAAAHEGSKEALTLLVSRHWPMLVALCRRTLGEQAIVEDVAQEAVLQAMVGLEHLQRPAHFGAWLAGIGLNLCRRWLRAREHEALSWEAVRGGTQGRAPWRCEAAPREWQRDPAELAEAADMVRRVRQAVTLLPAGQREAVLLFYLSGLTYAETADQLGITVGGVRTRLHRAREMLRQQLSMTWRERTMTTDTQAAWVEMHVMDVRRQRREGTHAPAYAMVLREVTGTRHLVLWIGETEAIALVGQLEKIIWPRPIVYTLMARLLDVAGVRLREARITQLTDTVFYAELVVAGPQGLQTIDARPSDAVNLALLVSVPIHVAPAVLATAAIELPAVDSLFAGRDGEAAVPNYESAPAIATALIGEQRTFQGAAQVKE